jgi:hypothetical protein
MDRWEPDLLDRTPPAVGVCVVRIEGRGSANPLVTVRGSLDVADLGAEWVVCTADVAHARRLVDQFLAELLVGRQR